MYLKKITFPFSKTQLLINRISAIDSFKGKWHTLEKRESKYLKELKRIATIESSGSSTRIEGAILTDDEIEKLLKNLKISHFENRDEQEVIGYYQALELILENYDTIDLTENYIRQLHSILLKESEKDIRHRGEYKKITNKVVAKYPDGTEKVIFNTTEPHLVDKEMFELINWVNKQFIENDIHPLFIIATFIYEFLSIHPFQDGNGRLSRLMTTLLLIKYGYDFVQYVSFEHIIENKKKKYYKALMSGQKNRYSDKENIYEWILFFLTSIEELISKLEIKYEKYNNKQSYLNSRQNELMQLIQKSQPLKISDIAAKLNNYSINTLKKDIQYLLSEKQIEKIGKGRGTIYIINDEST
ncbi:MAG: Fic family protein [Candidatus Tenebribacter mawsonii]|nr:Fic family protein [Candidatus Tenebribacter mawsonii]